ncbi:hypothetical protein QI194_11485 [Staphylococcus saprophyticus]|uniref:hypothetical protein n=1 Tax=Staphylococcus saprophyticus TaxID=29385 RepID=UPI001247296A|nr:hypothetical protein [Staphylococcus saprophyticus]MDW4446051.1 hypothetical protein [Staphylococcus saprophyticus]
MKKVLFLLLASFLVLSACGNEESKLEDKKETKASDKESNKDDKKKDDDKEKEKSDDKSNEEVATQDETTEQPVQSQEQVNTQEQQPVQSQEQAPVVEEQPVQQEPTDQEKMEANAKVAKEHGYTGIPNGDAGLLEPADEYYSNDQLDPETGLPMDDAVPHKTNE